jgi:hypothetical protein
VLACKGDIGFGPVPRAGLARQNSGFKSRDGHHK